MGYQRISNVNYEQDNYRSPRACMPRVKYICTVFTTVSDIIPRLAYSIKWNHMFEVIFPVLVLVRLEVPQSPSGINNCLLCWPPKHSVWRRFLLGCMPFLAIYRSVVQASKDCTMKSNTQHTTNLFWRGCFSGAASAIVSDGFSSYGGHHKINTVRRPITYLCT